MMKNHPRRLRAQRQLPALEWLEDRTLFSAFAKLPPPPTPARSPVEIHQPRTPAGPETLQVLATAAGLQTTTAGEKYLRLAALSLPPTLLLPQELKHPGEVLIGTVDWGDGQFGKAAIGPEDDDATGSAARIVQVEAQHDYLLPGEYRITLRLFSQFEDDPTGETPTATSPRLLKQLTFPLNVFARPTVPLQGAVALPVSVPVGSNEPLTLVTSRDPRIHGIGLASGTPARSVFAQIDWGDGVRTGGPVGTTADGEVVVDSHPYRQPGTYRYTVLISKSEVDGTGISFTPLQGVVRVTGRPVETPRPSDGGVTIRTLAGIGLEMGQVVARFPLGPFTYSDGQLFLGEKRLFATADFGDGTPGSVLIRSNAPGVAEVIAYQRMYTAPGVYRLQVGLVEPGAATPTAVIVSVVDVRASDRPASRSFGRFGAGLPTSPNR